MTRFLAALLISALGASGHAQTSALIFSPNGDGVKDQITFRLSLAESAEVSSWLLEIRAEAPKGEGALIKSFGGKGRPPSELKWDGKDLNNRLVQDGTYLFSLSLVTPAGNQVAIAPSPLIVDRVPPQIRVAVEPDLFSPNGDGNKDETRFSMQGEDQHGLYGWLLTLKDKDGAPVRSFRGKGAPLAVVPWDGRGDFEEDVPDGTYTFELTVDDRAGNRTVSAPQKVSINRAGLVSTVEVSPMIFSPNGDGIKDEVNFRLASGSPESVDRWELKILNANGKIVHSFGGKKDPPARIVWNGLPDGKKALPDGSYHVVLSETDHAGNTASTLPQPMEVDTAPPLLEARLEPHLLSPNGDGSKDEGVFALKADDVHPLEQWALKVFNDVGRVVKSFIGSAGSKPAAKIPWKTQGEDGQMLIDGVYSYSLEAADIAGNRSATVKASLRIDRTPPLVSVAVEPSLFSPNGDGVLDSTTFNVSVQDAGPIERWSLALTDAKGKLERTFTGPPESIPSQIVWDGKNQDRVLLPDGIYGFVLKAVDVAGNASSTAEQKVTIGATAPVPTIVSDLRAISPNADSYKDAASFKLQAPAFNTLKEWTFRIRDAAKTAQRSVQGRGDVPGRLQWGGERDDQRLLPDGEYAYELEVIDAAGNKVLTVPQPLRVDTTKPQLTVSVSPNLFSPNGDGLKDEAVFIPGYTDASPIAKWKLILQDPTKSNVRVFSGEGSLPLSLPWDGKAQDGSKASDGSYTFVFFAEDEVGNKATTSEQIVRLDNTAPEVALQAEPTLFSPNGDGVKDDTAFLLDFKDASDIAHWKLEIARGPEPAARTFSGLGRPPRSFPWDGKNDRGQAVPDGKYTAVLSVVDEVGNTGRSQPFALTVDTSKPLVTVTAETDPVEEIAAPMTVVGDTDKDIVISLESEVLFDTGQDSIKAQAFATLMKANHLLRRYPQRKIRIEGHADNVPIHNEQFKNNMELSQGRAEAILKFFADKGKIDASRMEAKGFGDKRPKASNDSEAGRRMNRRVEIILIKEKS